jgi:hypothetical protein
LSSKAASCAADESWSESVSELLVLDVELVASLLLSVKVVLPDWELLELEFDDEAPMGPTPGGGPGGEPGGGPNVPEPFPFPSNDWFSAPKIDCKMEIRSLLMAVSLLEVVVELLELFVLELPVASLPPDPIVVVELLCVDDEAELLPVFPSMALMIACSISCSSREAPELPLEPDWPQDCELADPSEGVCDPELAWLCSKITIKEVFEPLAPLIADMTDLAQVDSSRFGACRIKQLYCDHRLPAGRCCAIGDANCPGDTSACGWRPPR